MGKKKGKLVTVETDSARADSFVLFIQTAFAVIKYANSRFYKELGSSSVKVIVLQTLVGNGGTMTPSEIANWTLRERHDITTLISRMERDGLITTAPNTNDRRSILVTVTEKGRDVLKKSEPVSWGIVDRIMETISEEDISVERTVIDFTHIGH